MNAWQIVEPDRVHAHQSAAQAIAPDDLPISRAELLVGSNDAEPFTGHAGDGARHLHLYDHGDVENLAKCGDAGVERVAQGVDVETLLLSLQSVLDDAPLVVVEQQPKLVGERSMLRPTHHDLRFGADDVVQLRLHSTDEPEGSGARKPSVGTRSSCALTQPFSNAGRSRDYEHGRLGRAHRACTKGGLTRPGGPCDHGGFMELDASARMRSVASSAVSRFLARALTWLTSSAESVVARRLFSGAKGTTAYCYEGQGLQPLPTERPEGLVRSPPFTPAAGRSRRRAAAAHTPCGRHQLACRSPQRRTVAPRGSCSCRWR